MRIRSTVTSVLQAQPCVFTHKLQLQPCQKPSTDSPKSNMIGPFLVFRGLGWAEQTSCFLPATCTFQYFVGHKINIIPSNVLCAWLCCTVSQQDLRMRALKITSCNFLLLLLFYPWCPRNNRSGSRHLSHCILCVLCTDFCFEGWVAEGLNDI